MFQLFTSSGWCHTYDIVQNLRLMSLRMVFHHNLANILSILATPLHNNTFSVKYLSNTVGIIQPLVIIRQLVYMLSLYEYQIQQIHLKKIQGTYIRELLF